MRKKKSQMVASTDPRFSKICNDIYKLENKKTNPKLNQFSNINDRNIASKILSQINEFRRLKSQI